MFQFTRRDVVRTLGLSAAGAAAGGWMPAVARAAAAERRHCILLWMTGGPSQLDTFDLKPGHANGGPFKEIATAVPGLRISEHLPQLARQMDRMAILRGLSTREGDHQRGTHLMHTGHLPGGPIRHPAIGSSLSKHLGDAEIEIPSSVSIAPYLTFNSTGAGFLGAAHAPLTVAAVSGYQQVAVPAGEFARLRIDDAQPSPVYRGRERQRYDLLRSLEDGFMARHPDSAAVLAHKTIYDRAHRFLHGGVAAAFDLDDEPTALREAYGRSRFGQGCLLARRLIERGVAFVEVALGYDGTGNNQGWDTHADNFNAVKRLSNQLDAGWGTLMRDLAERGLLDTTTILWMGEFGRTPQINPLKGRDHFTDAWTAVLAGGGVKGGQAYGKTSADGQVVVEGAIGIGDLLATFAAAAGVPPTTENTSELGRPIKIAEGRVITEVTG